MKEFLMGNAAIAKAAFDAGVNLVSGYPGTPSTEVLENIARLNDDSVYVEWSVNEKAAMEVAAGAAYSGARTMVTMKQVGLNVASDPLMSLAYVGVSGGMVILVADDPGPISSQTEQDTRTFGMFSKVPVFDPSSVQEAYDMVFKAFEISEKYDTPVFLRPTTRICHSYSDIETLENRIDRKSKGFVRDTNRWVIFPKLSYNNHIKIEQKLNCDLSDEFSDLKFNEVSGFGNLGIAFGGISSAYAKEVLSGVDASVRTFKVATPFPFPERLAVDFLEGLTDVLVLEELDPVIERALTYICGKYNLDVKIHGKLDKTTKSAGENTCLYVKQTIYNFLGIRIPAVKPLKPVELPMRPPVLCAGCPHRASFYAVKQAAKGKKSVFCGDIGCYTLGNAMPLDMVDTCLCMGADITIAQGIKRTDPDTLCFSFIGDSTFFASGITGIINAVYNQTDIIVIVLDNSTTAMTGQQPHPGTGVTMMGESHEPVHIEKILKAIGLSYVETVSPFDVKKSSEVLSKAIAKKGVRAVIFKSPCIAVSKPDTPYIINSSLCIGCKKCITEIGCPAISFADKKATIEESLCFGCSLCESICPVCAIKKEAD